MLGLRDHPKLELELSTTDRLVDVVAEGFDCVLRVGGDGPGPGLQTLELGSLPMVNCISPMYADTYGTPKTLEDLSDHRLVHYLTSLGSRSSGFGVPGVAGASFEGRSNFGVDLSRPVPVD